MKGHTVLLRKLYLKSANKGIVHCPAKSMITPVPMPTQSDCPAESYIPQITFYVMWIQTFFFGIQHHS